jgi:2-methylcitrate dehydratase PrpD
MVVWPVCKLPFAFENDLKTSGDIFVNTPYLASCAVYRIHPSRWQDETNLKDSKMNAFKEKIQTLYDDQEFSNAKLIDPESSPARVEVFARDKVFTASTLYNRGAPREGFKNTDNEIAEKFKQNVLGILDWEKSNAIIQMVLDMEDLKNIDQLMTSIRINPK